MQLRKTVLILPVALLIAGWMWPIPAARAYLTAPKATPETASVAWPAFGQAALGAKNYGLLETYGVQESAPTASVAKVFTAVAVLKKMPLKVGEQGPTITINQADVDSYNSFFSLGGSLAQVALGEQISERQALEAMLLPSANNVADTLARWAFGSIDNYLSYISSLNSNLGLSATHIADPSGFSPQTTSTAKDLVKIAQVALSDPVLASIVAESQATVPVAGTVKNTNWLLGTNAINGIKTGNTDAAGGCYLFSSDRNIGGQKITVIGAVMAAPDLTAAMSAGKAIVSSVDSGFDNRLPLPAGNPVGYYQLPWNKKVNVVTVDASNVVGWKSKAPAVTISSTGATKFTASQTVGKLDISTGMSSQTINLKTAGSSGSAPWRWRLYQRFF